uniref:methylated-DNA--[protein]-cysteine S-methyltransferase n=1 Tax=Candidatus Scatomorpha intestinigallinarum TaxID=2840923 RepID=UPI00402712F7
MDYVARLASPVGELTLASDGEVLTGLWIAGQKYHSAGLGLESREVRLPVFEAAAAWLERYFSGERPEPRELPLAPRGSDFRQRVWRLLLEIPGGELATYAELASRLSTSPRAVGSAVGRNPISIIIPCHRVVGSDGSLTGYAAGLDVKLQLLRREGVKLRQGPGGWYIA